MFERVKYYNGYSCSACFSELHFFAACQSMAEQHGVLLLGNLKEWTWKTINVQPTCVYFHWTTVLLSYFSLLFSFPLLISIIVLIHIFEMFFHSFFTSSSGFVVRSSIFFIFLTTLCCHLLLSIHLHVRLPFCFIFPLPNLLPFHSIGTREIVTQKNLSGLVPIRDFRLDPSLLYSIPLLALSPNLLIVWLFLSIAYLVARLRCKWK